MDKIICIGKNYAEHVKVMAQQIGDKAPDRPVLFLKPPSVLRQATQVGEIVTARLPLDGGPVHHECEIVIRLGAGGIDLTLEQAQAALGEVTLGLDMTLRERQTQLKKNGHPWTVSKVFRDSAIIGPWIDLAKFPDYLDREFAFLLDGAPCEHGRGRDMITSPAECVVYASRCFPLCAGDLIFTGCPAGTGPVTMGQEAELRWGDWHYRVRWQ